ncbi:MAG TPA: hypothetical protein DD640_02575, partial [Clostridiales bacterium]|nr:hypothetical protein [Clostridiales bacterium]
MTGIITDFLSHWYWLVLLASFFVLPFSILAIRKMGHFGKLLGFYRRPARRPAWPRSDLSAAEATEQIKGTGRQQNVRVRSCSHIIDQLYWQIYMSLQTLRRRLSRAPSVIIGLVPASQWFFDNYNLFYKSLMRLQEFGNLRKYRNLPILTGEPGRHYPRIYILAREIISSCNYHLNEQMVLDLIRSYQSATPILLRELWSLPEMLMFGLLEKTVEESREVIRIIQVKCLAERMANRLAARKNRDKQDMAAILKRECKPAYLKDRIYVSHLFYRLKNMSVDESEITNCITGALGGKSQKSTVSLQDLIHQEEQFEASAESTIRSLVISLKVIGDINWEEELPQVSLVDQILSGDPGEVYPRMNNQTKGLYRSIVEKLARRFRIPESEIAAKVLAFARDPLEKPDFPAANHVGSYLSGEGKRWLIGCLKRRHAKKPLPAEAPERCRIQWRKIPIVLYYSGIVACTAGLILIVLLLARSDSAATAGRLIALAGLMLIPAVSLSIRLVQDVSSYLIKPRAQLAMDFLDGIPDDCRTMVVMPVIINSEAQVRDYVDRLEKHYLANRQENLYFALLCDFKDAPEQSLPADQILIQAAETAVHRLNARYPQLISRFWMLYRTRLWNPSENCWMGWERKRGKLEEFNALLAGENETSYVIQVGDRNILPGIRYVITLDADTELIRDSASTLVGIMAHPLNRPRIDPKTLRITDGYAIVQPEIRSRIPQPAASLF